MLEISLFVAATGAIGILLSSLIRVRSISKKLVLLIVLCGGAGLALYYTVEGYQELLIICINVAVVMVFLILVYVFMTQFMGYRKLKRGISKKFEPAAIAAESPGETEPAVPETIAAAKAFGTDTGDKKREKEPVIIEEVLIETEETIIITETEEVLVEETITIIETEEVLVEAEPIPEAEDETLTEENEEAEGYPEEKKESLIAYDASVYGNIMTGGHLRVMGKVDGDIDAEGDIFVGGQVTGELVCNNIMINSSRIFGRIISAAKTMFENGSMLIGDVEADSVYLNGKIKGNIKANRIVISGNSILLGDISTRNLAIRPGAVINGRINTLATSPTFADDIFDD